MELRHLRYFIAVAEQLHFSKAAEQLHIAQPPLSQQIRQLEQEIGVPLFNRTRRSVTLTTAGEAFLEEARKTLAQAERAIQVAHQAHQGEIGHLEIGFVSSATAEAIPELIQRFHRQVPRVAIGLHGMFTLEVVQALHTNTIQAGLLHPPIADEELTLQPICDEPLLAALPEQHPLARQPQITITQLKDEGFLTYPRAWNPGTYDQATAYCQQAGFTMRVAQETNSMQTTLGLVAAELGVALVPSSCRQLRTAGVVYRPLEGKPPTMTLALAWHPLHITPPLRQFIAVALHYAREKLALSQA